MTQQVEGTKPTLAHSFRDSGLHLASLVLDSSSATVRAVLCRLKRTAALARPLLQPGDDDDEYDVPPAYGSDSGDYLDGPSDCPTDQRQRILVAASFVRDAKHGRNPNRRTTRASLRVYGAYHSALGQAVRYTSTVAFIAIPLYEYPGWCDTADCEGASAARFWWATPLWPRWVSTAAELLCLCGIGCELGARLHFTGWREFRREWQTSARAAVALATAADVLAATLPWLRWRRTGLTRVLRIFVFLAQHHSTPQGARAGAVERASRSSPACPSPCPSAPGLRVACMNIFRTLPALTEVLLVLSATILLAAWAATLLFGALPNSNFGSIEASLLEMYTLSTVTNFPAVTIAAFAHCRASFLFFVAFLCVGVLLLMNLTLAIVYEAYRINLGREVQVQQQRQRRALRRAFDCVAVPVDPDFALLLPRGGRGSAEPAACSRVGSCDSAGSLSALLLGATIDPAGAPAPRGVRIGAWSALLRQLSPSLRSWQAEMLFHGCDADGAGFLDARAFRNVLHALQLRFEPVPAPAAAAPRPRGAGRWRALAGQALRGRHAERCFDALALLTAVAVAWPARDVALVVHVSLVGLFALEMVAKLAALGPMAYLRSARSRLDGLVVLVAVGALTYNLAELRVGNGGEKAVRWTLYVWIVRALRLLSLSRRFTLLAHTLRRLRTPVCTFLGVLFCFLYGSASIGVELFGGVLYEGAPCLAGSAYARSGYEPINFNSLPSALALAFTLLMVNDFGAFMDAAARCSPLPGARAYFVLFHLCNVVVVSNLLTSFILEATLRAWADVDADSAVRAALADPAPPTVLASYPSLQPRAKRANGAAGAASGTGPGLARRAASVSSGLVDSALVLDQRAAYLHRMHMRVVADRITLDDGREFAIQRVDSFTGLTAMEEFTGLDAPADDAKDPAATA